MKFAFEATSRSLINTRREPSTLPDRIALGAAIVPAFEASQAADRHAAEELFGSEAEMTNSRSMRI